VEYIVAEENRTVVARLDRQHLVEVGARREHEVVDGDALVPSNIIGTTPCYAAAISTPRPP
jgi:hypothetical protein